MAKTWENGNKNPFLLNQLPLGTLYGPIVKKTKRLTEMLFWLMRGRFTCSLSPIVHLPTFIAPCPFKWHNLGKMKKKQFLLNQVHLGTLYGLIVKKIKRLT